MVTNCQQADYVSRAVVNEQCVQHNNGGDSKEENQQQVWTCMCSNSRHAEQHTQRSDRYRCTPAQTHERAQVQTHTCTDTADEAGTDT